MFPPIPERPRAPPRDKVDGGWLRRGTLRESSHYVLRVVPATRVSASPCGVLRLPDPTMEKPGEWSRDERFSNVGGAGCGYSRCGTGRGTEPGNDGHANEGEPG